MDQTLEVASLSGKELASLRAYKQSLKSSLVNKKVIPNKNSDQNELRKEYNDLTNKRKAAYAHFQELVGLKK